MDIHKPNPWHGFREFLKEYAIIVVGVLTALGGEQIVEWAHHRAELVEARKALRAEVMNDAGNLAYAVREDRCFLAAIDRYSLWARGGPRAPDVIQALDFPEFSATVWDQVKAGPATHMPLEERLGYANFYASGANQLTLVARDREVAREIAGATAAGVLDREDAKALLRVSATHRFLQIKIGAGEAMLQKARALGVTPNPRTASAQHQLERLCGMVGLAVPN